MDQIRINATPNSVVVSPTAPRIKIRLATGPQGPAGPPAEVYVQQTQPANPQNVGAIWYQTDANGNIQAEHVWDGSAWLPTPTGTGITTIIPVAPITASGQSVVSVGINLASDTDAGAVARMATAGDVAAGLAGPAVDAAVLKSLLPVNTSDLTNDGDGVGGPYVDATAAGDAAPVQSLIAGNNIDITAVGRDFIIAAIPVPQHQSDWAETVTSDPAYIKNKPTNVSAFANDAGYITAADVGPNAPVQSVNGMTGAVTIDLSPYATNVDLAATNAKFADYLPLAGGVISGGLTVAGAFNVGPAGSARVPTVAATDSSTSAATTEWVQTLLAATGALRYMWKYGGNNVTNDPGLGFLDIAIGNDTIAISKTDGNGNQRYLDPIANGDTIVLTDDPATGPATEYQRFNVIGTPTDNGNWVSVPVSLAGGTSPVRVVGDKMRVTIGLDSQVATIEGVSAGYGLTGGGVSGVVSLAADLSVMAQLSDIPTKVSAFTNDSGYITLAQVPADAVTSVNSKTGVVVLTAADVGALPDSTFIPTHTSNLTNDSGFITAADIPPDAVDSVNGKTGDVVLDAGDVGALPANTAIPSKTSDLTNDGEGAGNGPFIDVIGLGDALTDYLPLTGGTLTGDLNANQGVNVGGNLSVIGVASGVTPAPGDSSTQFATTEFVASAVGSSDLPVSSTDGTVVLDSPAANTYTISTGGTERLRVRDDGNVGVGFAGRTYTRLTVGGSAADNANPTGISVEHQIDGIANGASASYLSSPTTENAIWGVYHYNLNDVTGAGSLSNQYGFTANDMQAATGSNVGFRGRVNATTGKSQYNVFCDGTAPNYFAGQVQVAAGSAAVPAIGFYGEESTGFFRAATDTIAISTAGTERLRVDGSGIIWLGGGTSVPSAGGTQNILLPTTQVADGDGLNLLIGAGQSKGSGNGGSISFATATPGAASGPTNARATRMVVDGSTGYVGIGTVSPTETLDIAGTARVQGPIRMASGTAAAPGMTFTADTSTGFFMPTAGEVAISTGGAKRFEIDSTGDAYFGGWVGISTPDDATATLDVNGESIRIRQSVTPASATATGVAGEIMWDANYLYICVATNTWKRVALTSW